MDNNENKLKKKLDSPIKTKLDSVKEKTEEDKVNRVELSFYICLVLLPFTLLVIMVISSILEYSRWPIYTETNITPQNEANLPAMTFCPAHSGYKENVLVVSYQRYQIFNRIQ